VAYPPLLAAVESYRGVQPYEVIAPLPAMPGTIYTVNQDRPVCLAWSPKGFASSYHIQIANNKDFTNPIVDEPYQTQAFYVWSNAIPATVCYYRVNTSNDAGTSEWSNGSFQTIAPMIAVTVPNGGEGWLRGVNYFVQWNGNTLETVEIDLYKGGAFLKSLATNSNTGAYQWEVGLDLVPGSDYSIKIRSTANADLFDMSDATFSIVDPPVINAKSLTPLAGGKMQLGFTAPGAAQATVWGTTALAPVHWELLGTLPLTSDNGVFTDTNAPGFPWRFYRISVP